MASDTVPTSLQKFAMSVDTGKKKKLGAFFQKKKKDNTRCCDVKRASKSKRVGDVRVWFEAKGRRRVSVGCISHFVATTSERERLPQSLQ